MAEQVASVEERIAGYLAVEEGDIAPEQEEGNVVEPETSDAKNEVKAEEATDGVQENKNTDQTAEEEVEEIHISALREFANHFEDTKELSDDELYSLTIPVKKPDGTIAQIPLGDTKDSYQQSTLLQSERKILAEERAAFKNEANLKQQSLDRSMNQAMRFIEVAETQLTGEMSKARLEELRVNDPAEYAAIREEYRDRMGKIETLKKGLADEYQQQQDIGRKEFEAMHAEGLVHAREALPKFIPEWADEKVASKEVQDINRFGVKAGFTEQELGAVYDPRIVSVLRLAMLYDNMQQAKPEVKKKVVSIGKKILKSGKSKSKAERKTDAYRQDYRNFQKKGGTMESAAALIEKHFLGEF